MYRPELNAYVSVISARRPERVQPMNELVGEATWFVAEGEAKVYKEAGAAHVVEAGALCAARNAALDAAFALGKPCIELSDDAKAFKRAELQEDNRVRAVASTFAEAVSLIADAVWMTGASLGGAAPTANPFYYNAKRPVHARAFIVGDFIYVKPSPERFDENMRLKEDYDFTLQHIQAYGTVGRADSVLAEFAHRSNAGGACSYRTAELEQEAIAHLRSKWPGVIADNPRRPNEILLRLPRQPKS